MVNRIAMQLSIAIGRIQNGIQSLAVFFKSRDIDTVSFLLLQGKSPH